MKQARRVMMGGGRSHEALLSLVLSGILPARRIVSFLRTAYGKEIARTQIDELAQRLNLQADQTAALRKCAAGMDEICRRLGENRVHMVSLVDPDYPCLLREIPSPPPLLFYKGSVSDTMRDGIAIVGSRRASLGGLRMASYLARELAGRGFAIVSGLARGIDTAAHKGALEVGGLTIAVLGTGIDVIYPSENRGLADGISQSGAVVTEFPPGTAPLRQNFPQRNRIISGLSLGTIVVEAGEMSGALITADCALEQNRSVFAVPGAPGYAGSRGTNSLLKQGAKLVESVEDILEEISPQVAGSERRSNLSCCHGALNSEEQQVMDLLSDVPAHVDEISRSLGLESRDTLTLLLALETKGLVRSMPGKLYVRERLM
jgi:DNA processing protein